MTYKQWLQNEASLYMLEYNEDQEDLFIERVGMMICGGIDEELARLTAFKAIFK